MRFKRLIRLRKKAGLTQSELAKALNCSKNTIGNAERGDQKPSINLLIKIANFFDESIDWLLFVDMAEQGQSSRPDNNFVCPHCGAELTVNCKFKSGG